MVCTPNARCSDASHVAGSLYVGNAPPRGADLRDFHLTVLCAKEYQPRRQVFRNVRDIIYVPLDDGPPMTAREAREAMIAGDEVARRMNYGQRVLVTCWAGRNRSGLVAAIALRVAYRCRGQDAVNVVRNARGPHALSNPHFVRFLNGL